ncbi:hypothetical protein SMD11_4071 [Streptomyces albireticuli]|uniref:Uncharacterized protein n=1 Tax=Streptomyces albireticuli TaxID=1940 RepID=A0A1Z2L5V0_9ACTN|nr:hypothetical protein SMD11_4071 [Streptomyces albireticuli]
MAAAGLMLTGAAVTPGPAAAAPAPERVVADDGQGRFAYWLSWRAKRWRDATTYYVTGQGWPPHTTVSLSTEGWHRAPVSRAWSEPRVDGAGNFSYEAYVRYVDPYQGELTLRAVDAAGHAETVRMAAP